MFDFFGSVIISILWASACRSCQVTKYYENLDSLFFNSVWPRRCHIGQYKIQIGENKMMAK